MEVPSCASCASRRPVVALLQRRAVERGDGRDFPVNDFAVDSAALSQDHPLCGECLEWLAGVVANLAAPQFARGALLGSPNAWSRVRVFPDQCQLCKEMLGDDAVLASSVTLSGVPRGWSNGCAARIAWINSRTFCGSDDLSVSFHSK